MVRTTTFECTQNVAGTVNSLRFETVKDYNDWLGRMRNSPAYMDQNIGLMRQGIKNHIVLPKVIVEKVLTQPDRMDLDELLPLTVLEKQVNIWIEKKRALGRKSAQGPKQDNPNV